MWMTKHPGEEGGHNKRAHDKLFATGWQSKIVQNTLESGPWVFN